VTVVPEPVAASVLVPAEESDQVEAGKPHPGHGKGHDKKK
jgi:hypothetical protein